MGNDTEINIKVTATADGLKSGLASATKEVESFGNEINDLAKKAQAVNPDAFKELAQTFNAGKADLDQFRDGLMAITTVQASAAQEATNLATQSTISTGAMREFVVVGRELASGNLTRLPGSLSLLASRLGGIPPAAILATGAIAAVGYAMYEAIDSSQRFEKELADVQISLQASGRGGSYSESFVTGLINELRQAADVSRDQAAEIVRSFDSVRTLGQADVQSIIGVLRNYATATHESTEQASKDLEKLFGGDTYAGIKKLDEQFNLLTPDQRAAADAAKAVGDQAGLTTIAISALNDLAKRVPEESLTGLAKAWNDVKLSLSGVNEEARHTRDALLAAADAAQKTGDGDAARRFRDQAQGYASRTRNLPDYNPAPSSQAAGAAIDNTAQVAAKKAQDELNDAIKDGVAEYEKGNSPLREQEQHMQRITRLQTDLGAALDQTNGNAAQKIQAQIDAENNRYTAYLKSQQKPQTRDDQAAIKDDAAIADARIKTEQDLVNEKQRLGEISTQEAVKQLLELAAQEHQINLRRIADMRAVAQSSGDKVGVTNAGAQAAEENERYAQQKIELDQRARQAAEAEQNAEIQGARRVADAQAETTKATMALKVASGQITAQQEIAAEIQSVQQRAAEEQKFYDQQLALYQRDSAAYQKTMTDKLVAEQKADTQILQLRTQLAQQSSKQDNQLTQTVTRGLNQTLTGVLQGTQTMGQAFQRLGQNIILSVITGALDRIVTSFLANNATIQGAQQSLSNFLNISDQQNAASSELTSQQSATSAITTYAAEGSAAAIASTAAIPIVGPELAPAAGAAIYADIMSLQVASAAGGMVVDQDQLAMVHENEMILPAHLSQGIGSMIANGQAGGGSNHFHFSPQINGKLGPDDIDGLHQAFTGFVQKGLRNGQFGGMRRA